MISKEEYKKTLVRMWDSVREDEFKGVHCCDGVLCPKCPLYNNGKFCYSKTPSNASYEAYDIVAKVEQWAKEHPIETNGSRFLKNYPKAEVYGCNYNNGFIYIRLDTSNPIFHGVEDCAKISIEWWESEVNE